MRNHRLTLNTENQTKSSGVSSDGLVEEERREHINTITEQGKEKLFLFLLLLLSFGGSIQLVKVERDR